MNRSGYILGIDQSTQGTKALLYDENGNILARCDRAHRQNIDERSWVEHDPMEIRQNLMTVVRDVTEKAAIDPGHIAGVGISNQRETALVWDRSTGKPLYPAIVWQCPRGAQICARLADRGAAEQVQALTGLPLSPYFSAAKWAWIFENIAGAKARAGQGAICCGTMDSWLVYCLTGGKSFKTDVSNASRTQLLNLESLTWDAELCKMFGIAVADLPEVCDSNAVYGSTDFDGFLPHEVPISAVMGDSHAALFGQGCHRAGEAKGTYGTGSSIMMNTGGIAIRGKGLASSVAWRMDGKVQYVLEGNINYTGAVINWLKDDMALISTPDEAEALARAAHPLDRTYLVPAFTGLGAPYWASEAHAVLAGMTRVTGRKEIVRAALDSIAYQIADVVQSLRATTKLPLTKLKADGAPTRNSYLMQLQSDLLGTEVEVSAIEELSASGAAYMAGGALGLCDPRAVCAAVRRTSYKPKRKPEIVRDLLRGWRQAVGQTLYNAEDARYSLDLQRNMV